MLCHTLNRVLQKPFYFFPSRGNQRGMKGCNGGKWSSEWRSGFLPKVWGGGGLGEGIFVNQKIKQKIKSLALTGSFSKSNKVVFSIPWRAVSGGSLEVATVGSCWQELQCDCQTLYFNGGAWGGGREWLHRLIYNHNDQTNNRQLLGRIILLLTAILCGYQKVQNQC